MHLDQMRLKKYKLRVLHAITWHSNTSRVPIYMFTQANIHLSNNHPGKKEYDPVVTSTPHSYSCVHLNSGHQFGQVSKRHQDSCYRARADKDHCGYTLPFRSTTAAHSHLFMPVFDSVIGTHSAITTTIKRTYSN